MKPRILLGIGLIVVFLLSLLIYFLSRSQTLLTNNLNPEVLLWAAAISASAAFLSQLKDVYELVEKVFAKNERKNINPIADVSIKSNPIERDHSDVIREVKGVIVSGANESTLEDLDVNVKSKSTEGGETVGIELINNKNSEVKNSEINVNSDGSGKMVGIKILGGSGIKLTNNFVTTNFDPDDLEKPINSVGILIAGPPEVTVLESHTIPKGYNPSTETWKEDDQSDDRELMDD